jgi:FixJ family two-component response regulator
VRREDDPSVLPLGRKTPRTVVTRPHVSVSPDARGKVFLVDDEASVRRAITRMLRASALEVEAFPDAEEFLAATAHLDAGVPACVLADLRMPGLSGLDLQQELRRRGIETPIVFISGRADVPSGVQAMKGGAIDFLEKPVRAGVLIDVLARALERDRGERAAQAEIAKLQERARLLTPREREVFALVVTGIPNKQIGGELGATEKTIKVHRARAMQKMRARSLADLVRMADKLHVTLDGVRKGLLEK